MEPTFYEDSRYRGDLPSRGTKRPMTLDLNAVKSSKKPRVNSLLTSPDFHKLKLESPELENLIIQQQLGMGPTSASQCMYPKTVQQTDDAPFPRDFPDALGGLGNAGYNLYQPVPQPDISILPPPTTMSMVDVPTTWHNGYHHQQQAALNGGCNTNSNNPMVSSTMSNNSYGGYYGLSEQHQQQQQALVVSVKEEPQTVPCASPPDHEPPRSPIDMEDQERMKLERKRLRNRIAASKCRRRKLEKIARLEDRVAHLKSENSDLLIKVTFLKDQVCHLKQQVMEHVRSGCDISTNSVYPSYDEL